MGAAFNSQQIIRLHGNKGHNGFKNLFLCLIIGTGAHVYCGLPDWLNVRENSEDSLLNFMHGKE